MKNKTETRISGKVLAKLNMPDFCPRCFWIQHRAKSLPWQLFPGIFSSIDAYTKKVMHSYLDNNSTPPPWIPEGKEVKGYLPTPHWSKFKRLDPQTGITVSGAMDDLFVCGNGSHLIPDYKTAKYTEGQDKLLPMYEAQLNSYGWVHEAGNAVDSLWLVYCEPATDICAGHDKIGFDLPFTYRAIEIKKDNDLVPSLLVKASGIISQDKPPQPSSTCKDCAAMREIISFL